MEVSEISFKTIFLSLPIWLMNHTPIIKLVLEDSLETVGLITIPCGCIQELIRTSLKANCLLPITNKIWELFKMMKCKQRSQLQEVIVKCNCHFRKFQIIWPLIVKKLFTTHLIPIYIFRITLTTEMKLKKSSLKLIWVCDKIIHSFQEESPLDPMMVLVILSVYRQAQFKHKIKRRLQKFYCPMPIQKISEFIIWEVNDSKDFTCKEDSVLTIEM